MELVPITSERKMQLDDYARRRGQDPAAALDEAVASFLDWDLRETAETLGSVEAAYQSVRAAVRMAVRAGRTRPASEFLEEIREKHGLSR